MKKMHTKISSFAHWFLPDMHHLPASGIAKNILFFLAVFGFGTMFLGDVSANTSITTTLNNSVMTIEKLRVTNNGLPSGTWVVEVDGGGIKINLGAAVGVLKRGVGDYITQGLVVGTDILDYTIDGTKIQNNAITDVKIAIGSITNSKIQDGVITCEKLNLGTFPGLSCAGGPLPNGSCAPGQFLQGITSGGGFICITPTGGTGSLPSCSEGQTVTYSGGTWVCTATNSGGGTGSSFWETDGFMTNIRNSNAGNVGVGINNPSSTLTVSGDVKVIGGGTINTGSANAGTIGTAANLATADANSIFYVGNGKVGILTSTPQYALDVVGTIRAASIITTSDARLKTNIKAIDNALSSLLGINGYSYILTSDGSNQYGVLAQEVEKFFPYIVSTDSNGYKAVNYNGLIAPMIQAIHELDSKLQSVEAKYQSNEDRISALEMRLGK